MLRAAGGGLVLKVKCVCSLLCRYGHSDSAQVLCEIPAGLAVANEKYIPLVMEELWKEKARNLGPRSPPNKKTLPKTHKRNK
eukprot:3847225-Amphidinium_carterae.1